MSYGYQVKFGDIEFSDKVAHIDPILTSQNGWVYKPAGLRTAAEIKSGKNKAWPRGQGYSEAHAYIKDWFQRQITSRNWELPISVERVPERPPYLGHRDALQVSFRDPLWGWVAVRLTTLGNDAVRVTLNAHELAMMYLNRDVTTTPVATYKGVDVKEVSVDRDFPTSEAMREYVVKWMQNPWEISRDELGSQGFSRNRLNLIFTPPKLKGLQWENRKKWENADHTIETETSGNAVFFQQDVVRKVFRNDLAWDDLIKIFDAFRFLGYSVRITYAGKNMLSDEIAGINVYVPANANDDTNELGHGIYFDVENGEIAIQCGYHDDETLWLERQKRKAAEALVQIEKDLYVEHTYDLTGKEIGKEE